MKKLLIFLALIISAGAQAQQIDCAKFSAAIEKDLKEMSSGAVSTGRNQVRDAMAAAVAASNIQSNLILMQANKCKMPTEPISSSYYVFNAIECNMKESRGTSGEIQAACDSHTWERKK